MYGELFCRNLICSYILCYEFCVGSLQLCAGKLVFLFIFPKLYNSYVLKNHMSTIAKKLLFCDVFVCMSNFFYDCRPWHFHLLLRERAVF